MIYLLDTNAVSDVVREHPMLSARLGGVSPQDSVVICTIVLGEVMHGIERLPRSPRKQDLEEKTAGIWKVVPCEPIPVVAARHYASIKSLLQRLGLPLDENDLWIAATALAINATVATRDEHFQRIPDLKVEDWTR